MYINDYAEALKHMGYKEVVKPDWYIYVKHDGDCYKVVVMLHNNFGSLIQTEKNLNRIKMQIENDPKTLPLELKKEFFFIILVSKKAFFEGLGKDNNVLQIAENGKYKKSLKSAAFDEELRELNNSRIYEQAVNNRLSYSSLYERRTSFITFLVAAICVTLMVKRVDPLIYGASYNLVRIQGQYQNLITANFLHVGFLHLLGNLVTLLIVGTSLEKKMGHARYFILTLSSALFTSIISISWYFIEGNPQMITVGLSGVLFAILGADIVHGLKYGENIIYSLALVVFNIISGVFSPSVNNAAHISGLIFGAWFMLLMIVAFEVKKDNLNTYIYRHKVQRMMETRS
jgi:rhomboid protease GluP